MHNHRKTQTKKYGVYHWDTFDNVTLLLHEDNDLTKCKNYVTIRYAGRIALDGADRVDIVDDRGNVLEKFYVR